VILINLLPHREARRQERKRAFYSASGLAAVVGVGLIVLWYGAIEQMARTQQSRNDFLTHEIQKLDSKIKDIADLKSEIDALKARQTAVENLQTDRNVPIYLLNELVKQTPEGVYLTSISQAESQVTIKGIAQTNERVSEFLRHTAYESTWVERPELIEIRAASILIGRDTRKLFDFTLKVSIKPPEAPSSDKPVRKRSSANVNPS
jgi:type IV pilus assembly protein PilN